MENEKRSRRVVIFAFLFLVAVSIISTKKASADIATNIYITPGVVSETWHSLPEPPVLDSYSPYSNYTDYIVRDISYQGGDYTYGVYYFDIANDDKITITDLPTKSFSIDVNYFTYFICHSTGTCSRGSTNNNPATINSSYFYASSSPSFNLDNSLYQDGYINQYEIIPEWLSTYNLTATFEYPKMLGPVFHADYKMTDLTTNVPVRIKTNVPLVLDPLLLQHIQVSIVQKTDNTYSTVKTVNPYLENYTLFEMLQYSLFEFTLPLLSGETNYFTLFYAFDDEYLSQHPGISIINRYDFSLTGLSPSDEDYEYGQTPVLPPVDSVGNTFVSTGSIIGDLVQKQLSETWLDVREQFADFFYIFDLAKNPPASQTGSAPLYSGDFQLAGKTVPVVFDPFHQFPIPPIVPQVTSFMAYFALGWFFIRKSSELFPE